MHLSSSAKNFYNQRVTRLDKLLFCIFLGVFFLGLILLTINTLSLHYTFSSITPDNSPIYFLKLPFVIGLMILAIYARKSAPCISFLIFALAFYYINILALSCFHSGFETTPFQPIDHYLKHIDNLLGFHLPTLVAFTHQHPQLHKILSYTYDALLPETLLIPVILGLIDDRKGLTTYLIIGSIVYIIMGAIYYFLPTNGPVTVFPHSPYFPINQHLIYDRFAQVHAGQPITAKYGGLIAFPSPHCITAMLIIISCYRNKWLFYPILIINSIMMASTLFLGWHYLVDVIGACITISVGYYLFKKIFKWLMKDPKTYDLLTAKSDRSFQRITAWLPLAKKINT